MWSEFLYQNHIAPHECANVYKVLFFYFNYIFYINEQTKNYKYFCK